VLAVDTNVLVYAHRREPAEHDQAFQLMRGLVEGSERWAVPWPCVYEFFGVVTNSRIWRSAATPPRQAWDQVEAWLAAPDVRVLAEPDGFASILAGFLARPRVRGGVVHDARVAAICVAHGVEKLLTRDRDFSLFPELDTENPFA
jgi:uncharacterized protein